MVFCRTLLFIVIAQIFIASASWSGEKKSTPGITPIAELNGHGPVDFAKEVQPILRKNCLACHGNLKPKADLDLENPPSIRKGGESGPAVLPGKGAESLIVKICSGQDEDSFMPPGKNTVGAKPLTSEQLGLLKLWIDQGALGDANAGVEALVWRPLPPGLNPILAVDISQDGQTAACTRANQIYIYNIAANQLSARLADPELSKDGSGGAADRDFVQSVAFNPDGTLLASGGFRCVKLWRKQPFAEKTRIQRSESEADSGDFALAFNAAAHRLAKGMADGRVEVWDSESAKMIWSLPAHSASVNALTFSSDGALLITGSADKMIRVWNAANGEIAGEIFSPVAVAALAFHDESQQVVSGGAENSIRVWKMPMHADYEAIEVKELKGHGNTITALEFINGGKQLLSSSADGSMILWNFPDGGQVKKFDHGGTVAALVGARRRKALRDHWRIAHETGTVERRERHEYCREQRRPRADRRARGDGTRCGVFQIGSRVQQNRVGQFRERSKGGGRCAQESDGREGGGDQGRRSKSRGVEESHVRKRRGAERPRPDRRRL